MKISPAKIISLLWIEKEAILPVVFAASKVFFRGECGASTTGDTCECSSIKKKKNQKLCQLVLNSFISCYLQPSSVIASLINSCDSINNACCLLNIILVLGTDCCTE